MTKQIKTLLKFQMLNYLSLNVIRYSRDKHKKNNAVLLFCVWIFLGIMAAFYSGMLTGSLISIGIFSILPAYLVAITSIIIFFFTMLKTCSLIFQKESYDTLCSLPVSESAIVISRFLRMYISNLIMSMLVMLPGMAVYAIMLKPGSAFYLYGIFGTVFLPLLPMTIATLFGAIITAISSKMKHKSIVSSFFSIILFIGIMLLNTRTAQFSDFESAESVEMIKNISQAVTQYLSKIYAPAIWLGNSMTGTNIFSGLAFFALSAVVFLLTMVIVSKNYHSICRRLFSTYAKHNYKMGSLKKSSLLTSLYKRELKRYFASGIYIMNTIVGPIMGVMASAALLIMGADKLKAYIPFEVNFADVVPIIIASVISMMSPTCASISLEGRQWWITKSLPIKTKSVIDSKILVTLSVFAPFYLICETLMMIALRPNFSEFLWILIIPAVSIVFSAIFGMTINLKMPVFDWENETTVVKQSSAAFFGGIGAFLILLLCVIPLILPIAVETLIIKLCLLLVIGLISVLLYRKDIKTDLKKLG